MTETIWKEYVGKYCRVPIGDFSYFGWLKAVTEHEMHFVAKDGNLKILPRGDFEISVIDEPTDRDGNVLSMPE